MKLKKRIQLHVDVGGLNLTTRFFPFTTDSELMEFPIDKQPYLINAREKISL